MFNLFSSPKTMESVFCSQIIFSVNEKKILCSSFKICGKASMSKETMNETTRKLHIPMSR